jgi:P22 coat protein - gene protein 5
MSNTITVAQEKLVLNTFAAIFENNLLAGDLVTWNKFSGEMNDRNGLTVVEQRAPRYTVTQTDDDVQDLTSSGTQDTVFGSEQFKVNKIFGTSMGWGDFQKIRDIGDARESKAVQAAALNLAEQADAYILRVLTLASNNWVGTPGSVVSTFDDVAAAHTRLKEEGVNDADIRAVLNYKDRQALGDWVVDNNDSALSGADGIYRNGFTGKVAGIPTLFTQQLPTLTLGTRTNGAVNGANQNVNYRAVANSPAPGQYLTSTINIDGLGANATIKDGEVFTIAGVRAYDNRLQAPLDHLQQFRVIGDVTASAGGAATAVRIFPALVVPATGTGKDVAVNTANATVDTIPADNAVVTFLGSASALIRPRIITKKDAVICNTMDLIMPATGQGTRKQLEKLPISIRMWKNSDFNTGQHDVRFDFVLNANINERRHVIRVNGA